MNFSRGTIKSSPYIGVFGVTTNEVTLLPHSILPKEEKVFERTFETETIKCTLAGTSLLGVLAKGIGRKICVSSIIEKRELKGLEKHKIEVLMIEDKTSTGNLFALNKNHGIASSLLKKESVKEMEKFFGAKFTQMGIGGSDLPGACLTVTNKGFICHPNINEKDFAKLEKLFKNKGVATTANFGDLFVGNSVLANDQGCIAGSLTSGIELSKIDEGLRG